MIQRRRIPIAASVVVAYLGLLAGCATVQQALQNTPLPTASLKGASLSHLSMDSVGLAFELEIQNPYPVDLPVLDLSYSLASSGNTFSSGSSRVGGTVPAGGSRSITLPLDIVPSELLRTLSSVRPGQVLPYEAQLSLGVDPPALAPIQLPLSHQGELPIPAPPSLSVASVEWNELSLNAASGSIALDLSNPNDFGFELMELATDLTLGDREVAQVATRERVSWAAGETQRIVLPLQFSPMDLGMSAFQMLTGSSSSYALDGGMQVQTKFGPLELPLSASGQTHFLR